MNPELIRKMQKIFMHKLSRLMKKELQQRKQKILKMNLKT